MVPLVMTKMITQMKTPTCPFLLTPMMPLVGSCWAVTKIVSALILQVAELLDCTGLFTTQTSFVLIGVL